MSRLSSFLSSIKIEDILASPPSTSDSATVIKLKTNPPKSSSDLSNFLSTISLDYTGCSSSAENQKISPPFDSDSDSDSDASSDDEEDDDSEDSEDSEDDTSNTATVTNTGRRSSSELLKNEALLTPFLDVANSLCLPCNTNCCFSGDCTINIPINVVLSERVNFFRPMGQPAPSDTERRVTISRILKKQFVKDNVGNDHYFKLDDGRMLCPASFVRLIGLSNSPDISKAPGQFLRLMKACIIDEDELEMLANGKIKLTADEKFLPIRAFQEAFIEDLAQYYSDALPAVKSKNGSTETKQLAYKGKKALYEEMVFQCQTAMPPVPESHYGSYSTFKKTYLKMHRQKKVQLLGGKGGFETCAFCNHCLAIKRSAAKKRDRATIEILRALHRLHLKQQHIERQHCENFIFKCKNTYNEFGEPEYWFVELDGMSVYKTMAPKLMKDRTDKYPRMENRLMGARIVCGPIDNYIAIATSDLIPGGANILIEATRIAIEKLAEKLALCEPPYPLPDKGGLNYDNSGENKNKYLFCWVQHLCDERYFNKVEIFFLFAGHTHSPIDQNFSVVGKAIYRASFVGSTVAMNELFKVAHDMSNQKSKESRITDVIVMELYHDYVKWYDPVANTLIHYHGGPHRYVVEFQTLYGISDVRYMWQSPQVGDPVWLPIKPPANEDSIDVEANIELAESVFFGGDDLMYRALNLNSDQNFGQALSNSSTTVAKATARTYQDVTNNLPLIRRLERLAISEQERIYEREAHNGRANCLTAHRVKVSTQMLLDVEKVMLSKNTKKVGHLVFLKRSLCKDIEWLNTRPEILPNPKRWREQSGRVLLPSGFEHDEAIEVVGESSARATVPSNTNKNDKEKGKEKKDPIKSLAVTRMLSFVSGARQMAKVASFMLELAKDDVRIAKSNSLDIVAATRTFKDAVLTERDRIFYENISSLQKITNYTELLVEREISRPWLLLRLPNLPELEVRREKKKKEQAEILARKTDGLQRLFNKVNDGFDVTREHVTRDGKEVIYGQSLDDMTVEQLKIIASAANIPGRSKLKRQQLVDSINKYLRENPNESLKSLCGEEEDTAVTAANLPPAESISSNGSSNQPFANSSSFRGKIVAPPERLSESEDDTSDVNLVVENVFPIDTCSVQECEECATDMCEECQLFFCNVLHKSHSSHTRQMLKLGYSFPSGMWNSLDPQSVIAMATDSVESEGPLEEESRQEPNGEITEEITLAGRSKEATEGGEDKGMTVVDANEAISLALPHTNAMRTDTTEREPQLEGDEVILDLTLSHNMSPDLHQGINEVSIDKSKNKRKRSDTTEYNISAEPGENVVQTVARKIEAILSTSRPDKEKAVRHELDYSPYDVEFLKKLSNELHLNIDDAISTRGRPTRIGVMNHIIAKLI